jgi:hypothetical protein
VSLDTLKWSEIACNCRLGSITAEVGRAVYANNVAKMMDCVKQVFKLNLSDIF